MEVELWRSEQAMQRDHSIRVLGPIDLVTPAGVRTVGSRNARALLGALVVAAGRNVPVEQLQFVLWGDAPPHSADNSLQTYVSRLRHLLGNDAVVRADHSYRLVVERDQIDALQFEDLLVRATEERSDPHARHATCRAALALWRGEPFGDLGDDETFRLEAMRLEELRLAVVELDLEAEIALGHHEIVTAELESAVLEHPLRERLWYLLAEALLCADRRVEALRTCQRLRETLADAGLEPGPGLRAIEDRIFRSDCACPPAPAR